MTARRMFESITGQTHANETPVKDRESFKNEAATQISGAAPMLDKLAEEFSQKSSIERHFMSLADAIKDNDERAIKKAHTRAKKGMSDLQGIMAQLESVLNMLDKHIK